MISLWKLREKKNVAHMPFVKNTPEKSKILLTKRIWSMSAILLKRIFHMTAVDTSTFISHPDLIQRLAIKGIWMSAQTYQGGAHFTALI